MMEGSDDLPETILKIIQKGTKKAESMPSPCIFRVPKKLRKVKRSAYTPQLISIGPLHSNKEHLKSPMEDIKKHYAEALFKRILELVCSYVGLWDCSSVGLVSGLSVALCCYAVMWAFGLFANFWHEDLVMKDCCFGLILVVLLCAVLLCCVIVFKLVPIFVELVELADVVS
ncbi:hypothetical protein LOK49_LG07G00059 [Camellia lanceoleosa]|uniref:Uncharacterized protein n=1 Tax=Camellia lanceoleosa TaxID=1840588 RepID=A0ACC0H0P8_9ERIC|nr:hypothetical protein LOK49_LG07G00059 [Camellia lanceoleosa]